MHRLGQGYQANVSWKTQIADGKWELSKCAPVSTIVIEQFLILRNEHVLIACVHFRINPRLRDICLRKKKSVFLIIFFLFA